MRYIIIVGLAIIGAVFGGSAGLAVFGPIGSLVFSMPAGGIAGVFAANWLLRVITPTRKAHLPRQHPEGDKKDTTPLPFEERLDHFATANECDRSNTDFVSKMAFWSLRDSFTTTPPKSTTLLRRLLNRIRALVSRGTPV